ncbi:uncharacterized protein FA14DRAFT_178091 [Meira miltonrushii]|uniref:BTB domain-containing protein n=1 Tax=Meira miltonrushii TaxID=1280837 RepID=A0A316VB39_9BASI|nr:uncharacterized protein FA14DRAFT_178091 [Meira miltonrushii]PWN34690.1 hypothetical protein FA14DRAFT_178091 [Meira miltonrushii]
MENGWSEDKSDKGGEHSSVEAVIPIKESRAAKNDLIIYCSNKNISEEEEIVVKRFGVEKAVLACHSIFFENTFDDYDKSSEEGQIQLPEQADVVETFLNCVYGIDTEVWSFDRCIDVIEMARNYEARIVERQAYLRLSVVPINKDREGENDLIIICQGINPETKVAETKRYGVEVAVLANHSVIFADMFTACDRVDKDRQIDLPEKDELVLAFLKIVFGQEPGVWPFDLCVDVIEMAKKYQARSVERHAYTQINFAFTDLMSNGRQIWSKRTRYGRLFLLQFILVWHSAINDNIAEASMLETSFKEKKTLILQYLGLEIYSPSYTRSKVECRKCRTDFGTYFNNGIFDQPSFNLEGIANESERSLFSISELLEFKLFLILSISSYEGHLELKYFKKDKFYKD